MSILLSKESFHAVMNNDLNTGYLCRDIALPARSENELGEGQEFSEDLVRI